MAYSWGLEQQFFGTNIEKTEYIKMIKNDKISQFDNSMSHHPVDFQLKP